MVVRRFREHVADHNWFAVAVDVGIVVLGVFLGTQVSNWNEERLDERRAAEYRERLAGELDFDARQYAVQDEYYRQARNYGLNALADIEGAKPLTDPDFLVAAYQLTQTDSTPAKTGVYAEMAANGLTDRLGDSETQDLASDFYLSVEIVQRLLETILPYRTLLREVMPYDLQFAIREECGDRTVYYGGRPVGVRVVVPCKIRLDPAKSAAAGRRIRTTPDIRRQMTRYIASIDEKLESLGLAHDQAEAFRKRLADASRSPET
ncbi:MAG: hypothetical protein ABI667_02415 [Sphingomicrobium sp.]